MSIFQQGLDMFKGASKQLKEIDEEPILENVEPEPSYSKNARKTALEDIKAQAREKALKSMDENSNVSVLLDKFKRFLSKDKRTKMISLCEREDSGKLGFVTMMGFNRVLKNMGFRLLFDEVKSLINALRVYDSTKDKVFYYKVISSAFRKLYQRDPYQIKPKPTQLQAITLIKDFLKNKKEKALQKQKISKETITPKDIINGLAQKIQSSGKSLLKSFEEIDKDHSGFIELPELDQLFQSFGVELNLEHLQSVFTIIDTDNKGKITLRDLRNVIESAGTSSADILTIIAVSPAEKEKNIVDVISSIKVFFKDTKMNPESTFKLFVKDGGKEIDADSFRVVLSKITNGYSQLQMQQVFQYIDTSKDGFISYREFSRVFFDVNETPTEILKRQEIERKQREENEIKKK